MIGALNPGQFGGMGLPSVGTGFGGMGGGGMNMGQASGLGGGMTTMGGGGFGGSIAQSGASMNPLKNLGGLFSGGPSVASSMPKGSFAA